MKKLQRALIGILLVALCTTFPPTQVSADDTVITFDEPGIGPFQEITDQYHGRGVDFVTVFGEETQALPVVRSAADAKSPSQVASITEQAGGEFPKKSIVGKFTKPRQHVRVDVRSWGEPSDEFTITMYVYKLGDLTPLTKEEVTFKSGDGLSHTLEIGRTAPEIEYFQLRSAGFNRKVGFDNLSFDEPPPPKAPDFGLTWSSPSGTPLYLDPGKSVTTTIIVQRSLNPLSTGAITLAAEEFPTGIRPIFSPNPTTGGDGSTVALTLIAEPSVAPGVDTWITVRGTPTETAGVGPRFTKVHVVVRGGDTYSLRITGVEVTQGTQNLDLGAMGRASKVPVSYRDSGGVLLVRGRKTVVRVYANSGDYGGGLSEGVLSTATLDGFAADGTPLPGGPLHPLHGGRVLQYGADTIDESERIYTNTSRSLLFDLPADWTKVDGDITLKAHVFRQATGLEIDPPRCRPCDFDTFTLTNISFVPMTNHIVTSFQMTTKGITETPFVQHWFLDHNWNNVYSGDYPVKGWTLLTPAIHLAPFGDGQLIESQPKLSLDISQFDIGKPFPYLFSPKGVIDSDLRRDLVLSVLREMLAGDTLLYDEGALHEYQQDFNMGIYDGGGITAGGCVTEPPFASIESDFIDGCATFGVSVAGYDRPYVNIGHEFFHMLGLKHASAGCGGNDNGQKGDTGWPDSQGSTIGVGIDQYNPYWFQGDYPVMAAPDLRTNAIKNTGPNIADPNQWFDLMSYCAGEGYDPGNPQNMTLYGQNRDGSTSAWPVNVEFSNAWISPRNWNYVVNAWRSDKFSPGVAELSSGKSDWSTLTGVTGRSTRNTRVTGVGSDPLWGLGALGHVGAAGKYQDVTAALAQSSESGPKLRVEALAVGSDIFIANIGWVERPPMALPSTSPYHLVLKNALGQVLEDTPMLVVEEHADGEEPVYRLVAAVAASSPDSIEITRNGASAAVVHHSPNTPRVQMLTPAAGVRIGDQTTTLIEWDASDADNESLTAKVEFSSDDGANWRPVYGGPNNNRVELPSSYFSGSTTARVRIKVSDGFNEGSAVSGRFTSVGTPPIVKISSPANGERLMNDASLYLSGYALDDTDHPVDAQHLTWYTGGKVVGSGEQISITNLPMGEVEIRLEARDQRGRIGKASIVLHLMGSHIFPETKQMLSGLFLDYWNTHGGLAQQGYPISPEFDEVNDLDGKLYTVQYFERAVFEKHPENERPFDVLLSQLGTFQYKKKYPAGAPNQKVNTDRSRYFPETKHTIGGSFRDYWEKNGGLAQQGYPISDEFQEKSDLDGNIYTVQYFERAVFEYHPENKKPNDVLLSQLGTFQYRQKHTGTH